MLNRKYHAFIGCDKLYEEAKIVMFGAPYDGTVSYRPGARFAPETMRSESYGLETYSPYLKKDLADTVVCDTGDLELCFGNTERTISDIEKATSEILKDGKLPFMTGGEHLVTLGAVKAAARIYKELCVIHFDAHADLRDDYLGEKLSHATVMRRCRDILGDGRIFQFGIRSGDRCEFERSEAGHTAMTKFNFEGLPQTIEKLGGKPVYLTVDFDVLDPSVFPGTGTPEPGGVSFDELRRAVTAVCSNCEVVACDVCELCPPCDPSGISAAAACKIIREMLLAVNIR